MGRSHAWNELRANLTEAEYEDCRDEELCCSSTIQTRIRKTCELCFKSRHDMIVRRLVCVSPRCHGDVVADNELVGSSRGDDDAGGDEVVADDQGCGVVWLSHQCTQSKRINVLQNLATHTRGVGPCGFVKPQGLTDDMKDFAARADVAGFSPREIVVNMRKDKHLKEPKHGWPTPLQVSNALKTIRKREGAKNALSAVRALVASRSYDPDISVDQPFMFGAKTTDEGFPYVGCGDDDDSFVIGITSLSHLDNCIQYASPGRVTMFHADATFKLSDIGYPVITCGITDRARSYQLAAVFVVSRRTSAEYAQCFQSLARLFKTLRGTTIDVDVVMGDADDAQTNAYQQVYELKRAQVLMCYFHVLYNVRKRTRQLRVRWWKMVMTALMDMHFAATEEEYEATRDEALALWRSSNQLKSFATYFEKQWLRGTFKRWQAYHTPTGYATTNNPCEVFNASIKRFFQRRRWHMQVLLTKLSDLISVTPVIPPTSSEYVVVPTTDLKEAARLMVNAKRVVVLQSEVQDCVFVRHVRDVEPEVVPPDCDDEEAADDGYDPAFSEAFDQVLGIEDGVVEEASVHAEDSPVDGATFRQRQDWAIDVEAEREKERASKLYNAAVKWALKRSHERGMPQAGWLVNVQQSTCQCKYYAKFTICAHVLVARTIRGLGKIGEKRLTSRIKGERRKHPRKLYRSQRNHEQSEQSVLSVLVSPTTRRIRCHLIVQHNPTWKGRQQIHLSASHWSCRLLRFTAGVHHWHPEHYGSTSSSTIRPQHGPHAEGDGSTVASGQAYNPASISTAGGVGMAKPPPALTGVPEAPRSLFTRQFQTIKSTVVSLVGALSAGETTATAASATPAAQVASYQTMQQPMQNHHQHQPQAQAGIVMPSEVQQQYELATQRMADEKNKRKAIISPEYVQYSSAPSSQSAAGLTRRHHTQFEMLGNFSLGDYFKEENIVYGWKFLTEELALPKERLHVTVLHSDDEARALWKKVAGLRDHDIRTCGEDANCWAMGDSGPCGPCSEIFWDLGDHIADPDEHFLELLNLVFMQFSRSDGDATLHALPKKSVDTGMGLERVASVLQQVPSNYHTDQFVPILHQVASVLDASRFRSRFAERSFASVLKDELDPLQPQFGSSPQIQTLRIIADHLRASYAMLSDGIFPSNAKRTLAPDHLISFLGSAMDLTGWVVDGESQTQRS